MWIFIIHVYQIASDKAIITIFCMSEDGITVIKKKNALSALRWKLLRGIPDCSCKKKKIIKNGRAVTAHFDV